LVEPEIKVIALNNGDAFLLCSDGITRHVTDAEIKGVMTFGGSPADVCRYLKDTCFERGAEDNLTSIVVRVSERSPWNDTASGITDEEDTISTARTAAPYAASENEDDLLEIGAAPASGPATSDFDLADELLGIDRQETIPYSPHDADPEPEADHSPTISDREPISIEPVRQTASTPAEPEFAMFGSSDRKIIEATKPYNGISRALFAWLCIIIGGLIGMAAYHFGISTTPEAQPVPPVLEMRSENIPFSSFEKNRRNVDADPAAYLKELPPPDDAEDHYLIGRAYLLTGETVKAKASLTEANAKLATTDAVNVAVLRTEINLMLAILDNPVALKTFQAGIAPVAN
jgi:hypothetical protein